MTVAELRGLFEEARPLVKQWLGLSEQFAAFRTAATDKGFDWSQIKALLKAQAMDERDSTDKHVKRIIDRAEYASSYAAQLGLGQVNEIIYSDEPEAVAPVKSAEKPAAKPIEIVPEPASKDIIGAAGNHTLTGGDNAGMPARRPGDAESGAARITASASQEADDAQPEGGIAGGSRPDPYPGDDDPLGPDLPAYLVRHPAVSA